MVFDASILQESLSQPMSWLGFLTLLSLIPAVLILMTSFTRIIIVLSLLRNAIGLPQTPPNIILINIALILTFYSMLPLGNILYQECYLPYSTHQLSEQNALLKASTPIKQFLVKQTQQDMLGFIHQLSHKPIPKKIEKISFIELIPAFLLSELSTAFQMGFMMYLPFLLIDFVVAGTLMGLGMMMVPPASIALPLKLLLFIVIDGWRLVSQVLIGSVA